MRTSETDLDNAQGHLGVRETRSLEKTGGWSTHGMDPHELLALPERLGAAPTGTLMVVSGGIPTLHETGRSRSHGKRVDASLVALHPKIGALQGQWQLPEPLRSIRHLAWDSSTKRLGIALQAERPDVCDVRWCSPGHRIRAARSARVRRRGGREPWRWHPGRLYTSKYGHDIRGRSPLAAQHGAA
jgi:hypothetical protein